jgi:hypothetical protein
LQRFNHWPSDPVEHDFSRAAHREKRKPPAPLLGLSGPWAQGEGASQPADLRQRAKWSGVARSLSMTRELGLRVAAQRSPRYRSALSNQASIADDPVAAVFGFAASLTPRATPARYGFVPGSTEHVGIVGAGSFPRIDDQPARKPLRNAFCGMKPSRRKHWSRVRELNPLRQLTGLLL